MDALRRISLAILWAAAMLGGCCAVLWSASLAGLAQPLVVVSGSMQPAIAAGDLLITTRVDTEDLRPGDVVSLPGAGPHLLSHRIESIERTGSGEWSLALAAEEGVPGALPVVVGAEVWSPTLQLPGVGAVVAAIARPQVGVPILAGLLVLGAFALLSPAPRPRVPRAA